MLNTIDVTRFPSIFPAATPTLADYLGKTITYINARPYERMPLQAVGIVIGYRLYKGDLHLKVENTTTCRQRWINAETDFVSYSHAL